MRYPPEIKAEALINYLAKLEPDNMPFRIFLQGTFKRNYSHDVIKYETKSNDSGTLERHFFLNRDGFYDKLPEGLFHSVDRYLLLSGKSNNKLFTREYERQKKEIDHARKFFQPFENEFFAVNLLIEELIDQWHKYPAQSINKIFLNIKSLNSTNDYYMNRIIGFLPSFPQIRGNVSRLAFFLKSVFQTEVSVTQAERMTYCAIEDSDEEMVLGDAELGVNLLCGSYFMEQLIEWTISLSVSNDELPAFVEGEEVKRVFGLVEDLFIPAGVVAVFTVSALFRKDFILSEKPKLNNQHYLGYNTMI